MTLPGPVTTDYLRAWGRHTHRSPLYSHLIELTAATPDLLSVIQRIENRPPPNVYLAAIQFLLMERPAEPLADFYASLVEEPRPVAEVDPVFIEFVLRNQEAIVALANRRYTQTNECRRCVALLPGIAASTFDEFHLVEIGTSAGLNLAFDRYHYRYEGLEWGPVAPVVLEAAVPGDPPRLREMEVGRRVGIDINVIDRGDTEDRRWLDALIWPEHHQRRERLRKALAMTADMDLQLIEGSVLDVLGQVLSDMPDHRPVVVMNSLVLNQLDPSQRDEAARIIDEGRALRPIWRVSLEFIDKDDDWARLEVGDGLDLTLLGRAHPHGEWVELDYGSL